MPFEPAGALGSEKRTSDDPCGYAYGGDEHIPGNRRTNKPFPPSAGRHANPVRQRTKAAASLGVEPLTRMPFADCFTIAWTACRETVADRVTALAAGVAFYVLLAVFPGIAALVALYGLFADADNTGKLLSALPAIVPEQAVQIISRQVRHVTAAENSARHGLGLTSALGFAVLLWSSNKGTRALLDALNVVHDSQETRSFLRLTLYSLVFTAGAIIFLLFAIGVVLILPAALDLMGLHQLTWRLVDLLRWPLLLLVVALVLAFTYRYGPSRAEATWRWITFGSGVASVLWVITSFLFSWTVSQSTSFDEVYGPLSAIIGFMIWIWLSTIVVLFGAELDAAADQLHRRMPHVTSR